MDVWHLTFRLRVHQPRTRARIRAAARALGREGSLLAFHVSDTHLHVLAAGSREEVGRLARRLELRLLSVLGGITPPTYTRIEDAPHLEHAFEYILRNDERHGVLPDPWRENSNLPDLLGLRLLASATVPRVREHLERVNGPWLRNLAGFPTLDGPLPAPDLIGAEVADIPWSLLGRDHPHDRGRDATGVRAALLHVAATAGVPRARLRDALAVTDSCVAKALHRPAPPPMLRAVRRQLDLRAARPRSGTEEDFGAESSRPPWRRPGG